MGNVRFVGLDVHKESIAIALAEGSGGATTMHAISAARRSRKEEPSRGTMGALHQERTPAARERKPPTKTGHAVPTREYQTDQPSQQTRIARCPDRPRSEQGKKRRDTFVTCRVQPYQYLGGIIPGSGFPKR